MDDRDANEYGRTLERVDPRWDATHVERTLAAFHRRRARRRSAFVLAGTLAAAVMVAMLVTTDSPAEPVARESIATAPSSDRIVRLSDGSHVEPEELAEVVVEHVSERWIGVRLERGAARFDVVPGQERVFEVAVGLLVVRVLGTSFRVERLDVDRAFVSVERGHVEVVWPDGRHELFAGESGAFPEASSDAPTRASATGADHVSAPPRAEPEVGRERRAPASTPPTDTPDSWRALAHDARYDEAYAAMGSEVARAPVAGDAVEDLLLAADVARLSGHPTQALPWLEAVERDHPNDSRATLATFTQGRLLMELGRPAEAAMKMEMVLRREPAGSLVEDALARLALAHDAAGNDARARERASEYLTRFRTGRWANRVRAIAARGETSR